MPMPMIHHQRRMIARKDGQNETAGATARPENIVVEGAGSAIINGTYRKLPTSIGGFDCYDKEGQWNGAIGRFTIFHRGGHWFFGFGRSGVYYCQLTLYRTMNSCYSDILPRKNGWMTVGDGVSPAPTLKW
jgi:hypothetical protein